MHRATAAAVAAVLAAHAGRGVRGQACVDDPDGTFMKIGTDCAAGLSQTGSCDFNLAPFGPQAPLFVAAGTRVSDICPLTCGCVCARGRQPDCSGAAAPPPPPPPPIGGDCAAASAAINDACCSAEGTPPGNCGAGGGSTPRLCTSECSPPFIAFWLSGCHDSILAGGADFQPQLDQLLGQCTAVDSRTRSGAPEMVHVALPAAGQPNSVVVTWQTPAPGMASEVGVRSLDEPRAGWQWFSGEFQTDQPSTYAGGVYSPGYQSGTVHRVEVRGLTPGGLYSYRVGDRNPAGGAVAAGALSEEMTYRHHRLGPDVAHRMVIVGDLGQSSVSQDTLRQVMALQPDSVQLNGDLAYANGHDLKWDSWQRLIQPLASAVPVMVAAGNHDISCSFPPRVGGVGWCNERTMDAYITRFTMPEAPAPVGPQPGAAEGIGCARHFACCLPSKQNSHRRSFVHRRNLFFSYDTGPAHVVVLCTYVPWDVASPQYRWAAADLASVDRSVSPWLIVVNHSPYYTSNLRHQTEGTNRPS